MSILSAATLIASNAAATTASGLPAKVKTVLLAAGLGSVCNNCWPSTLLIAAVMALITASLLPSLKLGIHSSKGGRAIIWCGGFRNGVLNLRLYIILFVNYHI